MIEDIFTSAKSSAACKTEKKNVKRRPTFSGVLFNMFVITHHDLDAVDVHLVCPQSQQLSVLSLHSVCFLKIFLALSVSFSKIKHWIYRRKASGKLKKHSRYSLKPSCNDWTLCPFSSARLD